MALRLFLAFRIHADGTGPATEAFLHHLYAGEAKEHQRAALYRRIHAAADDMQRIAQLLLSHFFPGARTGELQHTFLGQVAVFIRQSGRLNLRHGSRRV